MKSKILVLLFVLISGLAHSQDKINTILKLELDDIYKSDQILREYVDSETSEDRKKEIIKETGYENDPSFKNRIWRIMNVQDSLNLVKVERIISKYGYPGKSLVGEPTNESAWYVIQHSPKIAVYFSLIEEAAKSGEIPFTRFAMMQDRYLTQQGKEQIYGTQGQGKQITNSKTGTIEFFHYVSPIQNPQNVNELRKKAGFSTTVEENAKRMGMEYKVFTLEEIAKMN